MSGYRFSDDGQTGITFGPDGVVSFVYRGVYRDPDAWLAAIVAERCAPMVEALERMTPRTATEIRATGRSAGDVFMGWAESALLRYREGQGE